jgi:hypothetical protein
VIESWHNRNQLYIRGNIQTSNATKDFFDATATSAIATNFTHRQRNFIVAIGMYYRNQINIRGNKHISIATLN